jgi:hypothetical protein
MKGFYTNSRGYAGVFTFILPEDAEPSEISQLSFIANFKGPARVERRWLWQIRDFVTGKWELLADNAGVVPWYWSRVEGHVKKSPDRYVNSRNRIKLRYRAPRDVDDSDLDYLALNIHIDSTEAQPGDIWQPSPGTAWQIQLQGSIDTSYNVQMHDVDLFDTPQSLIDESHALGKTVICYFSAGSWEEWRADASLFPAAVKGRSNGWPGEVWLDIRNLDKLAPIM